MPILSENEQAPCSGVFRKMNEWFIVVLFTYW